MERKWIYGLFLLLTVIGSACVAGNKSNTPAAGKPVSAKKDSLQRDTVQLTETFNQEDVPANEYLTEELQPIRANFKRINTIAHWTAVDSQDLWEATEGGIAKFYYQNGQPEKIVARQYGETFQQLTEYYLLRGQLSFVFEKTYRYNLPMYYDSAAMKKNKDTEAFDFDQSEITETRSYFKNGQLLHQLNNQDCGSPFAEDYLRKEGKRINTDFEKLIKLAGKR